MSTSEIIAKQQALWYVFLLLPSFLIYVTSMVGETNRAPFDLPEAEGELVGGFHTEYSSLGFAIFMLAEYVNMTTVSALATTLFLGGWQAPWPLNMWDGANSGWWPLLWFVAKVWVFLFFFMWLRATLPRMRYDQFMALGWKVLIPISLAWIMTSRSSRTLRTHGYDRWAVLLIAASVVVGDRGPGLSVEGAAAQTNPRHRRHLPRTRARSRSPHPHQGARRCHLSGPISSTPSPVSASRSRRCSRSGSPRSIPRSPARSRCATTVGTSSTDTTTGWRSASAANSAHGRAPLTRSSSRAPTTPRRNGSRRANATAASTRSTICGASAAGCASRPAPPAR